MAVSDIIISPATVYQAPVGTALPSADTVQYGTAWGGSWTAIGYTLTPVTLSYEQELFELGVEQITLPVKRLRQSEKATIETSMAEMTAANLALPTDGVVTTVAAGVSIRGKSTVEVGGQIAVTEKAWGFEGLLGVSGTIQLPVRVFFYKATAELNGKLEFSKKAAAGIPLIVRALADTSKVVGKQLMVVQLVTAKATNE